MKLEGIRKLLVVMAVLAVTFFVDLNEHQAYVLSAVLYAFVIGNGVEHIMKGSIGEKVVDFVSGLRRPDPRDSGDEK